ncbi:unnamed protein product [Calypogeia fissa]
MAATIIESFFQRSLEDVVKGLRVQVIGEAAFLSKVLDEVRKEIKSTDVNTKAVALQKLTYLNMLQGTDMDWAAFHVVEVMSMPKFSVKKLGYLAASESFNESTDVLLLITNLLRKDFGGKSDHEASLAIECLSRVATSDLARDLLPELFNILAGSRGFVKKKATVALSRVFTQYPDAIRVALKRLIEKLSDTDPSVVTAAISVLCDLAMKDPKPFLPLAPELYNLLVRNPSTWLCIKLVKMLGALVPLEPRLGKKIADPICDIMRNSRATSLLLECIQAVSSGLTQQKGAVLVCVEKLTELLAEDDTNVKYLCLQALANLMPVHSWALERNNEAIARCLNHRDPSIQKGARRLIIGMVNEDNVIPTVHVLLQCAFKADADSCNELVSNILSTCSADDYLLISDFSWYVASLTEMARIPHCDPGNGDEIGRQLVDIGLRVKEATGDVLRAGRDLLLDGPLLDRDRATGSVQGVLKAAAWIAGEYNACSVDPSELVQALLQPRTVSLPASVRALYVQAVLKVFVHSWSRRFDDGGEVSSINITEVADSTHFLTEKLSGGIGELSEEAELTTVRRSSPVVELEEPEGDFSTLQHPGDPSTNSLEEQIQTKKGQRVHHDFQDSSSALNSLKEGRGRGAVKEKAITTVKEQQKSLLGFLEPTFELIAESMTALAESSDVEMQERACNLLGLLQVIKDDIYTSFTYPPDERHNSSEVSVLDELLVALHGVLTVEFSPVSVHAQSRVTAPEGLILENLDSLGPPNPRDIDEAVRDSFVIEREAAFNEFREGRKFFSFQGESSPSSVVGESAALLAQHRQRHQNFYLPSEGKAANKSSEYPPPVETYLDPEQLVLRAHSTGGSIPLGEGSTKPIRSKVRPVVVSLDHEDDHHMSSPSLKSKQKDLKDDFISSAIIDVLSGGGTSRPSAHKHQRVTTQHSSRLSRHSDRDNSLASSRVKDGSFALGGRGDRSLLLAEDDKLSNEGQGSGGTMKPMSKHDRHHSHEKETISSSSPTSAGYEPQPSELPRSSKGRARPRRSRSHKGTSLLKKLDDTGRPVTVKSDIED